MSENSPRTCFTIVSIVFPSLALVFMHSGSLRCLDSIVLKCLSFCLNFKMYHNATRNTLKLIYAASKNC